jgi:hypothetical protein
MKIMKNKAKTWQIYFILYVRRIMKITTFSLMVLLCVIMTSTNALAEARAPQLVITAFVEALHNDDTAYLIIITGQDTQAKAEAFYHETHEGHEGKYLKTSCPGGRLQ